MHYAGRIKRALPRYVKTAVHVLIILSCCIRMLLTEQQYSHQLPIGKQRPSEFLGVEQLTFSPGGEHFYRAYIHLHRPVVIKDAAKRWPLLTKWNDRDDENEQFMANVLPVHDEKSISTETVRTVIEKRLQVETVLDDKLLEEIHLPLILQCQEYVNKLIGVHLRVNCATSRKLQFSSAEELIVAFDQPIFVLLFGINETLSGESIKHANMAEIDVEKFPHVIDIPYQYIELHVGDMLYIPKYTWYHIGSISALSYISIKFDLNSYKFQKELQYVDALKDYEQYLLTTPSTLKCNNTKSSFGHSLNKAIDFKNKLEVSHLRIPRKNERPDDIVLASGYTMPVLGLGTALLNESTYKAVKCALNEGYRLFDLAHAYPFCEISFRKALSESSVRREDVFVVTKLPPKYLGYNETLYAIDESLERLNSSYIDLYLIHSKVCDDFLLKCDKNEPKGTWKESWRAMEYALNVGKIRSLGVSNFYADDIYELLNWSVEPVSVIQNWFDPFNPDKETRKICSEYNIRFMGFSTLGNYWRMLGADFNPVFSSSTLIGLATHYDYVVASVVLRWAIHENVTVIPRSSNPKHIGQNIRALDLSLLKEEIDIINSFDDWMGDALEKDTNPLADLSKWTKNDTKPN